MTLSFLQQMIIVVVLLGLSGYFAFHFDNRVSKLERRIKLQRKMINVLLSMKGLLYNKETGQFTKISDLCCIGNSVKDEKDMASFLAMFDAEDN